MDLTINTNNIEYKGTHLFEKSAWKKWIIPFCIFGIGFGVAMVLLGATAGFVSTDDYYHSRIAAQIFEQRSLRVNFPWLPLTILSPEQFVDHHLLYHIYLSPWMYWGGITGAKTAQAVVVGGILLAAWSLLSYLQVRYASIWTLLLFGVSAPFLYRMLMVRTQGAAVLLIIIALHLLFRKRYIWLVGLAFAFTWLYNGFILLPAIVFLYVISVFITERRIIWQALAFAILGTILGLVINPYFPQNISFIINHLGEKVNLESNIRVGSEWYPYTTGALMQNSLGALLLMVLGFLAPSFRKSGRDQVETTLLLVALITLYMMFESRRFVEYFPAFALLFGSVAIGRRDIQWANYLPNIMNKKILYRFYLFMFAMSVFFLIGKTVSMARQDVKNAEDVSYMAGASEWLKNNTEPKSLVFQTDWDDFTYLYFFNTHNTYLVGLDPTYLQVANPSLWNLWIPITQGIVERPSVLIRDRFGAKYVVSDTHHDAFAKSANDDPNMRLVYQDTNSIIWQIGDDPIEK